jgi:UDP-N-acetylmuramate: L-alanyl-gamma-D-glutamyl-meso-diaminopimelate ligase
MDKINIHIIGVAGTMTAPLAVALQKQGHSVTGSDQDKIYPPISDNISSIPLNQPLGKIDLCIVGSSYKNFSRCFSEFEQIKSQNIPYISATEYIAQNLIKDNSIIVTGSYGKTTISAILAHTIPNINYFFGGQSVDDKPSLVFSDNNWSIVEGDESIHGLDDKAKFLYYKTKYVILTCVNWEHKDSYQNEAENMQAYRRLVENIPSDGLLIYNPDDQNIQSLLPFCKGKVIPYIKKDFPTTLVGKHNQENISAAYTLCHHLGLDFDISGFKGIKRRLEIVRQKNDILVIDDFAQSPERVITALKAVQFSYPNRRTFVYFEPHASFLRYQQSLTEFTKIKEYIHQFILGKIKFSPNKDNRVTASNWKEYLGDKLTYIPIDTDIVEFFRINLQPNDILIHFSSGGLDGLNTLKTVYNNI